MIIYIDSDFKCHVSAADGLRAVETDFFDGKCKAFIEGYRFVPKGETWIREDGEEFIGEMVSPWKDLSEAYIAQTDYLEQQTAQYEAALTAIETALEVTS